MYAYEYPRPAVTVDCIVLQHVPAGVRILLIKRKNDPFRGKWAFPGGFMDMDETPEDAASRELLEETGIQWQRHEQVGAFGKVDRDPRGRTVSIVYAGFVADQEARASSDADEAGWFDINDLPPMAFDHGEIFENAIRKIVQLIYASMDLNGPLFGLDIREAKEVFSLLKKSINF